MFLRLILVVILGSWPASAAAYIGPGAGFAFIGSASIFFVTLALIAGTLLFWPLTALWRLLRGKRLSKSALAKRVIILGLDGLDPKLVDQYSAEGKLPNLKKLGEEGCYKRLGTTIPPISPVAWSTFQTGVNPGAHNIFDFLSCDKRNYLPSLSSSQSFGAKRELKIGRWKIPLGKGRVDLLRKSQPFWKLLGKHGIFSTIVRVPITYPPEKFKGNLLSAMCTPDLRGTQGEHSYFVQREDQKFLNDFLVGPENPLKEGEILKVPFSVSTASPTGERELCIQGKRIPLKLKETTDWIEIYFTAAPGIKIQGIFRACLQKTEPGGGGVELYCSPINIDPRKPILPISEPALFSKYYAERIGLYGTLGLMEDTWGRNDGALDDQTFLEQTYKTHQEREEMFFDSLRTTKEGLCVTVFDASDRIQHIFWRYIEDQHPAPQEDREESRQAIPEMYSKMDDLVGRTVKELKKDDLLIVMSDHGFTSFRRCLNLNYWLYKEGYLVLKGEEPTGVDYLQDVDWSKTRAFALGLTGIFINQKGRERLGIVPESEALSLKGEIAEKLVELVDQEKGESAVKEVYDSNKCYQGLYVDGAPDLIIGYHSGYRVSWDSVTGKVENEIFSDNLKAWSGDHNVAPDQVPGIFFSNRKIERDDPNIIDLAPTVLKIFDLPVPGYMEGKSLFTE